MAVVVTRLHVVLDRHRGRTAPAALRLARRGYEWRASQLPGLRGQRFRATSLGTLHHLRHHDRWVTNNMHALYPVRVWELRTGLLWLVTSNKRHHYVTLTRHLVCLQEWVATSSYTCTRWSVITRLLGKVCNGLIHVTLKHWFVGLQEWVTASCTWRRW